MSCRGTDIKAGSARSSQAVTLRLRAACRRRPPPPPPHGSSTNSVTAAASASPASLPLKLWSAPGTSWKRAWGPTAAAHSSDSCAGGAVGWRLLSRAWREALAWQCSTRGLWSQRRPATIRRRAW